MISTQGPYMIDISTPTLLECDNTTYKESRYLDSFPPSLYPLYPSRTAIQVTIVSNSVDIPWEEQYSIIG